MRSFGSFVPLCLALCLPASPFLLQPPPRPPPALSRSPALFSSPPSPAPPASPLASLSATFPPVASSAQPSPRIVVYLSPSYPTLPLSLLLHAPRARFTFVEGKGGVAPEVPNEAAAVLEARSTSYEVRASPPPGARLTVVPADREGDAGPLPAGAIVLRPAGGPAPPMGGGGDAIYTSETLVGLVPEAAPPPPLFTAQGLSLPHCTLLPLLSPPSSDGGSPPPSLTPVHALSQLLLSSLVAPLP
ncbi:hypothetical protein TeGR_g14478, partial [Tetraparma gracilis]